MLNTIYDHHDFFQSYLSRSSEKNIFVDEITGRLEYLSQIKTILDIGSNDGYLLKRILQRSSFFQKNKVIIDTVEPSTSGEKIINNLEPYSKRLRYHKTTIEDFFSRYKKHYDLIIASQCLYWSSDLNLLLRNISHLSTSACIVLRGDKGIYEIQSRFKKLLGNPKEQLYTSDTVSTCMLEQNILFERQSYFTSVDLPEPGTSAHKSMLSFFLQADIGNLSTRDVDVVSQYIYNDLSVNSSLQHRVDFFWLGDLMGDRSIEVRK